MIPSDIIFTTFDVFFYESYIPLETIRVISVLIHLYNSDDEPYNVSYVMTFVRVTLNV